MSEEEVAQFETMAAEHLWNWTGQNYGLCDVVLRPCRADYCGGSASRPSTFEGRGPYTSLSSPFRWGPALIGGRWFNLGCGWCGDSCSCNPATVSAVTLPGPVASVTEVLVNGEEVPPTAYRVEDGRRLIRHDGIAWPTCQEVDLAPTEPGTWQIKYQRGTPVPSGGQVAAGLLACEFAKAACNDSSCKLPQRVQTITRQGVTMAMLDPMEDIDKGHTGIFLVDSWVASVTMPQSRPGRVYSVDVPRRR